MFDLAFSGDGPLWATASAEPYRLDLSGGFPGEWVLLLETGAFSGAILPLGGDGPDGPDPDTLAAGAAGSTRRSVDGGQSWAMVYPWKGDVLYEFEVP